MHTGIIFKLIKLKVDIHVQKCRYWYIILSEIRFSRLCRNNATYLIMNKQ